jgi:hypothetical protein
MPARLTRYCLLVVKRDGEIIEPLWDDLHLISQAPDLIDGVHRFLDELDPRSNVVRQSFGRSRIEIEWWRLPGSVVVANMTYQGRVRHTLFLLPGTDREAEEACLGECEGVVASSHPRADQAALATIIRDAPRPLLVSIGNDGWGKGNWSFIPTEGVFAAAYFYRLQEQREQSGGSAAG